MSHRNENRMIRPFICDASMTKSLYFSAESAKNIQFYMESLWWPPIYKPSSIILVENFGGVCYNPRYSPYTSERWSVGSLLHDNFVQATPYMTLSFCCLHCIQTLPHQPSLTGNEPKYTKYSQAFCFTWGKPCSTQFKYSEGLWYSFEEFEKDLRVQGDSTLCSNF